MNEAWGRIVGNALQAFCEQLELRCTRWNHRTFFDLYPRWTRAWRSRLPAVDWISSAEKFYLGHCVFLLHEQRHTRKLPRTLSDSMLRDSLLPHGACLLRFGVEEALLEMAFAHDPTQDVWLACLERAGRAEDHALGTDGHFVSHWIIANS